LRYYSYFPHCPDEVGKNQFGLINNGHDGSKQV
jgi:hypothetical protein